MQQLPVFLTASKPRLHWVRRLLTLWNSVRSKSHSSSYKSEESYDLESLHVDVIEFRMVVNFVYWLVWCLLLICLLPVVTFFPTSFFMRRWRVRIFSGQLHFGEGQTQNVFRFDEFFSSFCYPPSSGYPGFVFFIIILSSSIFCT